MRILVTNDDGIRSEGIKHLANVAKKFGEVKIFAPDRERSCCGHSVSFSDPVRITPVAWDGADAYEVTGVPADCINLGMSVGWPDGCDLILSGINYGPNLGLDVTYSGTVAGAMEGTVHNVRSIAISTAPLKFGVPMRFDTAEKWLTENLEMLMNVPQKKYSFLNVNIPSIDYEQIHGHKVVGTGHFIYKPYVMPRVDAFGKNYYWFGGTMLESGWEANTDMHAISEGYVSITPLSIDWTNYEYASELNAHLSNREKK